MKNSILMVSILFIVCLPAHAQENTIPQDDIKVAKNAIYGNAMFLGVYGTWSAFYDRRLFAPKDQQMAIWARIGGGQWESLTDGGDFYMAGLSLLAGKKSHHFEFSFSFGVTYDKKSYENDLFIPGAVSKSDYIQYLPIPVLGYRYQPRKGGFLFRTGVSYPEIFYAGIGVSF